MAQGQRVCLTQALGSIPCTVIWDKNKRLGGKCCFLKILFIQDKAYLPVYLSK